MSLVALHIIKTLDSGDLFLLLYIMVLQNEILPVWSYISITVTYIDMLYVAIILLARVVQDMNVFKVHDSSTMCCRGHVTGQHHTKGL